MQLVKNKSIINPDTDVLPTAVASLLTKAGFMGDFEINPLHGGYNNRVFRIDLNGSQICLKSYFKHHDDPRNRVDTEFSFVSFAWNKGVHALPKPIVCDKKNRLALYELVSGRHLKPKEVTENMVQQALAFYCDLNRFKDEPEASSLPRASEACFSMASHLECVENRIDKLLELNGPSPIEREAVQFIHGDLLKSWRELAESVHKQAGQWGLSLEEKVAKSDRCLSPSDFGFHNAILATDGQLRFIDFEYAGWDDPAKTIADFFSQPAVPVPLEYYDYFESSVWPCLNRLKCYSYVLDCSGPPIRSSGAVSPSMYSCRSIWSAEDSPTLSSTPLH